MGVDKEVVDTSFEDRFLDEFVSPCLYGCDLVLLIDIGNWANDEWLGQPYRALLP